MTTKMQLFEEQAVSQPRQSDSFQRHMQMAQVMAKSNIIPQISKGKPYSAEDILSLFLIGERLGIDPMAAVSGIWILNGRPSVSARLCRALILRNGHTWRVKHWDAQRIEVEAARKGDAEAQTFEFTIKEAAHAGLTAKDVWQKHPRPMLMAAITRRVVDAVFPDLLLGMAAYEQDEFSESEPVFLSAEELKPKKRLSLKKIKNETEAQSE